MGEAKRKRGKATEGVKPLRDPGKRYSQSQDIGRRGQKYFAYVASRIGLIPVEAQGDEDVGLDFLCQTRSGWKGRSARMHGDLIAVPVRATTRPDGRIKLYRDDAAHLLLTRLPVMLALVHFDDEAGKEAVFYRALDTSFADELIDFIEGDDESRSFTPRSPGFARGTERSKAVVESLCAPNYAFQLRLHILTRQARKVLPDATIDVQTRSNGQVSLVYSERLTEAFDVASGDSRTQVLDALFGHSESFPRRLDSLSLKPELLELGRELPRPVVLGGAFPTADTTICVRGAAGVVPLDVEWRSAPGWSGFVHRSGFCLRISDSTMHEGQRVHFIEATIDPEHPIDLREHSDLEAFLSSCIDGAKLLLTDDMNQDGIEVESCESLYPIGAFVSSRRRLPLEALPRQAHVIDAVPSAESINTIVFWSEAHGGRELPSIWGFSLSGGYEVDTEPTSVEIPVCANMEDCGLVLWILTEVKFVRHEDAICGLGFAEFELVRVEERSRFTKASVCPELVVRPDWPSVALGPIDMAGTTDVAEWGCEIMVPSMDDDG